jgi:hypothetical protein
MTVIDSVKRTLGAVAAGLSVALPALLGTAHAQAPAQRPNKRIGNALPAPPATSVPAARKRE